MAVSVCPSLVPVQGTRFCFDFYEERQQSPACLGPQSFPESAPSERVLRKGESGGMAGGTCNVSCASLIGASIHLFIQHSP